MPLRVLVVVASYGSSNDQYLERLIREYQSMLFDTNIIIVSNIEKKFFPEIECQVGLPNKDPWSLPFAHKKLFVKYANDFDLFVYSEDDVLITERNLRAILDVTAALPHNEVAGFLRIEKSADSEDSYPDVHGCFHWDPSSTRSRGRYTLAHFTNEHSACYVLTQAQLKKAIASGGFLVSPHQQKYDLLCTAATDPYTQCGLTKLIPVSHIYDFTVHHLSNKYAGKIGIPTSEMERQIKVLIRLHRELKKPISVFNTETKLPLRSYSKDYYEPISREIISEIPITARKVLSIGCGWGATEKLLVDRGIRVVAIPLDPVVSDSAATHGIEMIDGSFDGITEFIGDEQFDCVLCLNILHLMRKPVRVLFHLHGFLSIDSPIIIQSPNMVSIRAIRSAFINSANLPLRKDYESAGTHFSSVRAVRTWCIDSGFKINRTKRIIDRHQGGTFRARAAAIGQDLPPYLTSLLASSIVVSATKL